MPKVLSITLALLIQLPQYSAAALYRITDLGIAGRSSDATDINSHGDVAGLVFPEGDPTRPPQSGMALGYFGSAILDLGTLGGELNESFGINDRRLIVGASSDSSGFARSFIYDSASGMRPLPIPAENGSAAVAINNRGQIVGNAYYKGSIRGYIFSERDGFLDLGTFGGGFSAAAGINEHGDVVGYATTADNYARAFLFRNGILQELSPEAGNGSVATSINDHGDIVGSYHVPGVGFRAFLYDDVSGFHPLAAQYRMLQGNDINNLEQVVGRREEPGQPDVAVLFDPMFGSRDLISLIPDNTRWSHLVDANGINDRGQIVGRGLINGEFHAFLMTPIPEPGSLALLTVAVAALTTFALVCGRNRVKIQQ